MNFIYALGSGMHCTSPVISIQANLCIFSSFFMAVFLLLVHQTDDEAYNDDEAGYGGIYPSTHFEFDFRYLTSNDVTAS